MTKKDRDRYDMLIRVREFGTQHGQRFPENSAAPAAFAAVTAEIERLAALNVTARNATEAARVDAKQVARRNVCEVLTRAGQAARVLARASPELTAYVPLPLPRADHDLIALGRQFAERAGPFAAQFATLGVPLPDVEARTTAFEQAVVGRGKGRQDRVETRAAIKAAFIRADHAVTILDLSVASCLATDSVALAVWKHGRRVPYPRRGNSATAEFEPAAVPQRVAPTKEEMPAVPGDSNPTEATA